MRRAGLLLIALTGSAQAGDGETAVSASAGWGTYATPNPDEEETETLGPTVGGGLAATYERGFGDYASWRVHGAGAIYGGGGLAATGVVTAGLTYRVDVLRYVPYAAVGVGGLVHTGGPFETGLEPVLEIGGGVDWLRGRDRSWGAEVSITGFASDTTTVAIRLRSTWRWGFF